MTTGLLALMLSASPVAAPPAELPPSEEIKRRLSAYNAIVPTPAGHASVVGGVSADNAVAGSASVSNFGYVYEPAYCMERHLHGSPSPYEPRAGDIVLM